MSRDSGHGASRFRSRAFAGRCRPRPAADLPVTWGSRGGPDGAGLLYVTDADNGVVERYGTDGTLESRWSGFTRPVAVAPTDGLVYVGDFYDTGIRRVQCE
ncbi:MAG: hypothetical protein HY657_09855 [Acidobacteria bacterium]|nr:hypothetical protein [Acidobacteriota bacterium]